MPTSLGLVLTQWAPEPTVMVGLALLSAGYLWLLRRPAMAVSPGRQACFWIGIATLVLALLSPLDQLSDVYLLSAHMVQHLLLTLIVAPLFVRALPASLGARIHIHPVAAILIFNFVFSVTHAPLWYDATLHHEALHAFEHLAYIGTAFINWLPVLNPARERRLPNPVAILYLFAETLPMFLVGSILALSHAEIYTWYLRAPRLVPWTPVQDQSVAGLVMWIGGSFFYLAAATVVFFRWAANEIEPDDADVGSASSTSAASHHPASGIGAYDNGFSPS
ncbi:MAG TPA: cytochrome c oxidase assembly protein [Chloroflexota bacterium]|nr:cytochrome c oxidase assembly protein [Chloroflexota bacterium]